MSNPTETKFAIALTLSQIEYLLDILEPISENDSKLDQILQSFDESFELDSEGNFIPHN